MAHVPPLPDTGSFDGPTVSLTFDGFLFDMDGTIIDSTEAIIKGWYKIGKELGVDPELILQSSHGRRSIDTIALYDKSKANWDYVAHIEGNMPREFGSDAVEILGARALLDNLSDIKAPWAIVTSGSDALMSGWLEVMKLPRPAVAVVAENVKEGKPNPECYILGRQKIGLDERSRVLVFEDASAGLRAGKAAGCTVLGLSTTHTIDKVLEAGADYIVRDLRSVSIRAHPSGGYSVELKDTWRDRKQ